MPPTDLTLPVPRPTLRLDGGDGSIFPYAYGPGSYSMLLFLYDTLLLKDPAGSLQPWLASSVERSPDGLAYRFDLRQDARWHDGRPVTADDVVFSFEYFRDNAERLPPTVLYKPGDGTSVEVGGPSSLVIRLNRPTVSFPESVAATFPIVPRHIWSGVAEPDKATDPAMLVGSGPYRLESSDPKNGAHLFVANDNFFLGKPFVKRLELRRVNDVLLALRGREIDAGTTPVGLPTRKVLPVFRDDPKFGVVAGDPSFFFALSWNLAKPGPTSDLRFRRACAFAINRPRLVERLLGSGEPGNPGFLAPGNPFHVETEQYAFDPERANRLLDEAGYRRTGSDEVRETPDGKKLRIKLLTFPQGQATAEIVREDLAHVGVQLDFEPTDFFTAIASGRLKNYEMALLFFAGATGDPDFLRKAFSSRTEAVLFHALGWKNSEFDDLADRQEVALDPAERKRLVGRMQELIAAELPVLVLDYPPFYLLYRRAVFDQWSLDCEKKFLFVTGKNEPGIEIRPTIGA